MTRCSCGADNPDDAKFCSNCGLEQTVATHCVCGAENAPDAKFCTNCGSKLVQREGQGHGDSIDDSPLRKGFIRWDNWVLWFLVGLVLIFLFFVCVGALGSTTQVSNPTADAPVRTIASPPTPTSASKCESEAVQTYFRQAKSILGGLAETFGVIGQLGADASVNPALIVDDSWHTDMTDSLDALDTYAKMIREQRVPGSVKGVGDSMKVVASSITKYTALMREGLSSINATKLTGAALEMQNIKTAAENATASVWEACL